MEVQYWETATTTANGETKMEIISTSTSFCNGSWEVWALVRVDGLLAKRMLVRTADLDEAMNYEK